MPVFHVHRHPVSTTKPHRGDVAKNQLGDLSLSLELNDKEYVGYATLSWTPKQADRTLVAKPY